MGRLPVAPRPYRDELLSSWLGRVACRYGLDAEGLVDALFADREGDAHKISIDDAAPSREEIVCWAQACGVDPARLLRLTLARRRAGRANVWFSSEGPPWAPTAHDRPLSVAPASSPIASPGATSICGRTGCWRSAVSVRRIASSCGIAAHVAMPGFASHFACATGGSGSPAGGAGWSFFQPRAADDGALIDALISIQDRIGVIVSGPPQGRRRLEKALRTLWAPLDDPGAARPVLALWIDQPGWRCPTEAQGSSARFPLGRLPIGRVSNLVAADAAFGLDDEALMRRRGLVGAPRHLRGRTTASPGAGCFFPWDGRSASSGTIRRLRANSDQSGMDGCGRAAGERRAAFCRD